MTAVFKVSYVVRGGSHPGAIINEEQRPQVGQRIKLGAQEFEVVEVVDLMPARGDFSFLHVTLQPPKL